MNFCVDDMFSFGLGFFGFVIFNHNLLAFSSPFIYHCRRFWFLLLFSVLVFSIGNIIEFE